MNILIEKEKSTPEVSTGSKEHILNVVGIIVPENPEFFFEKLNNLINLTYNTHKKIVLDFNLEYFNTGAARFLYKLFINLKDKDDVEICWRYEEDDEDIYDSGKEFESLTSLKFNFEKINL
ncbi:MAG: hypothetical protein C0596_14885 [Marinilabiliales bacterium]|nr:MAG: hypothetical protein C0596_14885 [Marinilabiliales bacterium]